MRLRIVIFSYPNPHIKNIKREREEKFGNKEGQVKEKVGEKEGSKPKSFNSNSKSFPFHLFVSFNLLYLRVQI